MCSQTDGRTNILSIGSSFGCYKHMNKIIIPYTKCVVGYNKSIKIFIIFSKKVLHEIRPKIFQLDFRETQKLYFKPQDEMLRTGLTFAWILWQFKIEFYCSFNSEPQTDWNCPGRIGTATASKAKYLSFILDKKLKWKRIFQCL